MIDLAARNICFIAGTLAKGGAEQQLYYLLQALRALGNWPHRLCLTRGEYWEEPICNLGVGITWVGQYRGRWRRLREVMKAIGGLKPDIVQSQHFYTNIYAAVGGRWHGACEIGAIRNDAVGEVKKQGAILGPLSMRMPRWMAANSQAALLAAETLGVRPGRTFFLPNMVDTARFQPVLTKARDPVKVLAVGRLVEQKRMDRFLRVLHRVQQVADVPVQGVIVGEGPLRTALEQQAAEMGLLPEGVEFRGQVADMTPAYQEANIFMLTSDREGTPNVVLEAMAAGLPVVATRVGGVPDLIAHEQTGLLFIPDDEAGMEQAVLQLIHNAERRAVLGQAARRFIDSTHALERLPKILASLYAWVEGERSGQPHAPRTQRP